MHEVDLTGRFIRPPPKGSLRENTIRSTGANSSSIECSSFLTIGETFLGSILYVSSTDGLSGMEEFGCFWAAQMMVFRKVSFPGSFRL